MIFISKKNYLLIVNEILKKMSKRKFSQISNSESDIYYNDDTKRRRKYEDDINYDLFRPVFEELPYPKQRTSDIGLNINTWVSGTDIKNFINNDPLLDWLENYYEELGYNNSRYNTRNRKNNKSDMKIFDLNTEKSKFNVLLENGKIYEECVFDEIISKFGCDVELIAKNGRDDYDHKHFLKTLNAMKSGVPIILQGVLFNYTNCTKGMADIIIRSDYLNKICDRKELTEQEETIKAPNLSGNYHYRIIDIKWTNMTLCAKSQDRTIRNEDRFPSYKGQLCIYNTILGKMQGYTPTKAYIMAKSWESGSSTICEKGFSCFDRLGTIDYENFDNKYIDLTVNAIKWVRQVRRDGILWSPLNPHINEMCANASNKKDAPWTLIKKDIMSKTHEPTQIWRVAHLNRNFARNAGVKSLLDDKCTVDVLGVTGSEYRRVINNILTINHQTDEKVMPKKIKNNVGNWQERYPTDFYIDFETLNDYLNKHSFFDIYDSRLMSDIIFMIGVGYLDEGKWIYKVFYMNKYSITEENRILIEFINYLTETKKKLDPDNKYNTRLFHWSHAELTNLNSAYDRHKLKILSDFTTTNKFIDLCKIFTSEPITVKGGYTFQLKDISKNMYENELITSLWDDDGPSDGLSAMIEAMNYYNKVSANTINHHDRENFNKIIKYNEIDCKVMAEIVDYLRKYHT